MFETTFIITPLMFFIKPDTIFFHKLPKTFNICIFPSTTRCLWFKYFLKAWEKYWHEATLQGNSKNHKIKMLFKTEKQNWNLNYLERLFLQPCFYLLLSDLALRSSLLTWLEQKSTRRKKYTHNDKKQCFFFYYKCDWSSISPNSFISLHFLDFFDLTLLLRFPLYTCNISISISEKVLRLKI